MGGLQPAVLLGIALDCKVADLVEHEAGSTSYQFGQPLTFQLAEVAYGIVRRHAAGEMRHNDSPISPGSAAAKRTCLQQHHRLTGLGRMQCNRQAGIAAADDRDVIVRLTFGAVLDKGRFHGCGGPVNAAHLALDLCHIVFFRSEPSRPILLHVTSFFQPCRGGVTKASISPCCDARSRRSGRPTPD